MKILILAALFCGVASAQTPAVATPQPTVWFTVANEGDTVVFGTSPITVQFGVAAGTPVTNAGSVPCVKVGGCWDLPLTLSSGPPVTIVANLAQFGNVDPSEGTTKVLQVQETTSAQTLTVNGAPRTVPALGASPTASVAYTLTIDSAGKIVSGTCSVTP